VALTTSAASNASDGSTTVVWTGNGLSDGVGGSHCSTTNSDLLSPGPGQKGWLFVLNQISGDPADWRLDVNFGPGTADDQPNLVPTVTTSNTAKWAVYSAAGDTLDGATAYATGSGGTSTGNLVVSHCFGGAKASPSIVTKASGAGTVGDTLSDTATLSGGVNLDGTGSITFKLYGPGQTCGVDTPLYTDTVTGVNANGDYSSDNNGTPANGNVALTAGTYQWAASFSGDANNNPVALTGCGEAAEANVVEASVPDVETQLHDPDHNVIANGTALDLGAKVHDSATVTGPAALGTPDGHVDFVFYNLPNCSGDGTAAGTIDPLADGASAGEGVAHPSTEEGALAPGSYGFKAFFVSDNTAVWQNNESQCEPFTVKKGQLTADTILHAPDHSVIANGSALDLGSKVHDTAQISGQVAGFDPTGAVTFTYYSSYTECNTGGAPIANDGTEVGGDPKSLEVGPLAPGSYAFQASVAGDTNYEGDTSDCEPFTVKKGDLRIRTDIHDAFHNVVTFVPVNGIVHDTATLGGANANFNPDLTKVSFVFFSTIDCTGSSVPVDNVGNEGTYVAKSADKGPLASGAYSFQASFAGDDNYNAAGPSACEPLSVRTFGKTMGYWGNRNGQARIPADFTYTLGAVSATTCYISVTKAKTVTILPNTKNGVSILTNCTTVASRDPGINTDSLNTLLAQALALKLNIQLVSGFDGQQLGAFGPAVIAAIPTAFPAGWSLTATSTVQQVLDYANYLIAQSKLGGVAITQPMIGQLNTLLGLINAEA
jgi:hypothetical protein